MVHMFVVKGAKAMSQHTSAAHDTKEQFQQWCFHETVELERKKQNFTEEREAFEEERRSFEQEKRRFERLNEQENSRLQQQEQLINMKRRILEEELRKLANEKEQIRREKQFYERRARQEQRTHTTTPASGKVVQGEMFFKGVANELALKKRYKDLIKIYHPDNLNGDHDTILEINREYEKLKKAF